jgi:hypothetical protein
MKGISVYLLDAASKAKIQDQYTPQFPTFVGHHVTYEFGSRDTAPLPPGGEYWVVGYSMTKERRLNGSGIEALVVSIDGSTNRPDGGTYHITWSYGPGYAAKDSNKIIDQGYTKLTHPIKIIMTPAFVPFK